MVSLSLPSGGFPFFSFPTPNRQVFKAGKYLPFSFFKGYSYQHDAGPGPFPTPFLSRSAWIFLNAGPPSTKDDRTVPPFFVFSGRGGRTCDSATRVPLFRGTVFPPWNLFLPTPSRQCFHHCEATLFFPAELEAQRFDLGGLFPPLCFVPLSVEDESVPVLWLEDSVFFFPPLGGASLRPGLRQNTHIFFFRGLPFPFFFPKGLVVLKEGAFLGTKNKSPPLSPPF